MFQGATALSLDVKGRLAIPARHREALVEAADGQLVLTAHPHRCLLLYPEPAWLPIRDKANETVTQSLVKTNNESGPLPLDE